MLHRWEWNHFPKKIFHNDHNHWENLSSYIGDSNTLFKGIYLRHAPTRFVFDWTSFPKGCEIRNKKYSNLNGEDVGKRVSIDGFISGVDVPQDLQLNLHCCPKCGGNGIDFMIRNENGLGRSSIQVCEQCSVLKFEDENADNLILCNEADIQETKPFTFNIQSQRIIVTHPDSMKKCVVYVHSNRPMFNKKDIGKKYNFTGRLRTPKYFQNNRYMYPQELVDLIDHNTNKDYKMSYLMIAPHIEEVPIDDSIDETINVNAIREDVSPEWRKEVLARDKHCVICGGEKHLEAHHIFGYKGYPQLRDNVDNGITLCQFCHGNYHSQYGVKNPNPVTLVKFVKQF